MTRRFARRALVAVLVLGAVTAASATPAQAIPPAGPGQSVTYTYFAEAAKINEVGWYSYGSCGEPFDFGTHTRYFTYRIINCGVN